MSEVITLNPAEAKYLLTPNMSGMIVIKVMLLMLIAKGILRIEETEVRWLLRNKKVAHLRIAAEPSDAPPGILALLKTVREAQTRDGTVAEIAKRAQKDFAPMGAAFVKQYIAPSLIGLGLLREKKFLFVRLYQRTPAGDIEAKRIEGEIARAKEIPALLKSDPAKAAALAASLGGTLLLVDELNAHYKPLADAMRDSGVATDGATYGNFGGDSSSGGFDFGGFDAGSFDAGSLGALDSGMSSFDSGFSDGGGGDSGGDSGGGGHH